MTTALPLLTADPTLSAPTALPPINPNPLTDPEIAAPQPNTNNTTSTNPRTSYASSAHSLAWSPSHPCYPHPNPHLPPSSPLSQTTRIIRIPRDWLPCGDLAPQFSNTYPEILEPWVSEQDFRILVTTVNEKLKEAFNPFSWWSIGDAVAGVVSGWLWEDLGGEGVGVKRGVRECERWVEGWNREREGKGDGEEGGMVRCWGVRRTGLLSLDIQIPDPQIRVLDRNEEGEQPVEGEGPPGIEDGENAR